MRQSQVQGGQSLVYDGAVEGRETGVGRKQKKKRKKQGKGNHTSGKRSWTVLLMCSLVPKIFSLCYECALLVVFCPAKNGASTVAARG